MPWSGVLQSQLGQAAGLQLAAMWELPQLQRSYQFLRGRLSPWPWQQAVNSHVLALFCPLLLAVLVQCTPVYTMLGLQHLCRMPYKPSCCVIHVKHARERCMKAWAHRGHIFPKAVPVMQFQAAGYLHCKCAL